MNKSRNPTSERVETALAFGSNIGEKSTNIDRAIALLERCPDMNLKSRSALFKTPPWGYTAQDWFLNACALFTTSLDPEALLCLCKQVEEDLGREKSIRWGPRLIDIDILTMGGREYSSPALTIPHPHLRERGFVLVPLNDIAPELDIGGTTVRQAMALVDIDNIEPFPGRTTAQNTDR